jgi:hypothetical protein
VIAIHIQLAEDSDWLRIGAFHRVKTAGESPTFFAEHGKRFSFPSDDVFITEPHSVVICIQTADGDSNFASLTKEVLP